MITTFTKQGGSLGVLVTWAALQAAACVPDARLHIEFEDSGAGNGGGGSESGGQSGSAGHQGGGAGDSTRGGTSSADGGTAGTVAGGGTAASDGEGGSGTSGAGGANGASGTGGNGATDLSGRWTGLTSDQRLFDVRVFANAVTRVTFDWLVRVPVPGSNVICVASGETSTSLGTPVAIDGAGRFTYGPVAGTPISYTVSGTFTSQGHAMGNITVSHAAPDCTGSLPLTWTAEQIVCGDGRIQWPETCDDDRPECTATCQLTPVVEVEPNDSVDQAGAAITSDAVISGGLSSGTDLDVFAIGNPYAGTIAVELETHGETVGTCHVDTVVELVDDLGRRLAYDDDSSRAWYCSLIGYSLQSGRTIYARVSSASGGPIPQYNLHVRYPRP